MITKPKQFYWQIEDLWAQYYGEKNACNFDFTPSESPVFFDDNDKNKPYCGLYDDAQRVFKNNKQVFLTDNHHKVLHFMFEQFVKYKKSITVIHIDAHRDDAIFQNYEQCSVEINAVKNFVSKILNAHDFSVTGEEYEPIKKYIKIIERHCRVSDYLDIAKHLGFVKNVISVTQTSEFTEYLEFSEEKQQLENIILNLDIDIYGEEGSAVANAIKTKTIARAWKNATSVCIATSPAFIEADIAENIIKLL